MKRVLLKVKRQDDPEDLPYWELFEIPLDPGMTVVDALEAIRRSPVTAEGNPTAPVVWDCSCAEGICGACTMQINGKARLACSILVEEFDGPIVLEPLSKFPIVRDLKVDRAVMLDALRHHRCWGTIDGLKPPVTIPPRVPLAQEKHALFSDCILCGACSEACPQVNPRSAFRGAFLFSHILFQNRQAAGREEALQRLRVLAGRGGLADCAGAENCERVCPRGIPLVKAQALLSWELMVASIRQYCWGSC